MTTRSRDIAQDDWQHFFDRVSRHYKGRAVDIECLRGGQGVHSLAKKLPFIGVTLERAEPGGSAVEVIAGNEAGQLVSHVITEPRRVWMRQEANGGDNGLGIESADGSTIVVEFATAHPGQATVAGHPAAGTSVH